MFLFTYLNKKGAFSKKTQYFYAVKIPSKIHYDIGNESCLAIFAHFGRNFRQKLRETFWQLKQLLSSPGWGKAQTRMISRFSHVHSSDLGRCWKPKLHLHLLDMFQFKHCTNELLSNMRIFTPQWMDGWHCVVSRQKAPEFWAREHCFIVGTFLGSIFKWAFSRNRKRGWPSLNTTAPLSSLLPVPGNT